MRGAGRRRRREGKEDKADWIWSEVGEELEDVEVVVSGRLGLEGPQVVAGRVGGAAAERARAGKRDLGGCAMAMGQRRGWRGGGAAVVGGRDLGSGGSDLGGGCGGGGASSGGLRRGCG